MSHCVKKPTSGTGVWGKRTAPRCSLHGRHCSCHVGALRAWWKAVNLSAPFIIGNTDKAETGVPKRMVVSCASHVYRELCSRIKTQVKDRTAGQCRAMQMRVKSSATYQACAPLTATITFSTKLKRARSGVKLDSNTFAFTTDTDGLGVFSSLSLWSWAVYLQLLRLDARDYNLINSDSSVVSCYKGGCRLFLAGPSSRNY